MMLLLAGEFGGDVNSKNNFERIPLHKAVGVREYRISEATC